jgi:S1-C subfamily serine protease
MRCWHVLAPLAVVLAPALSLAQFRPIEAPAAQPLAARSLDPLPTNTRPLPELQAHITVERDGLRLASLDQTSVASKLGLMRGDLITHVNGWPVRASDAFTACVNTSPNVLHYISGRCGADGKFFVAELWKDGQRYYSRGTLLVFLSPDSLPLLGSQFVGKMLLVPELGMETRVEREGLRITRVDFWGAAQKLGLTADDVITQVNGRPIYTHLSFRDVVFDTPDAVSYLSGVRPSRGNQAFRAALRRTDDTLQLHQAVSFVSGSAATQDSTVSLLGGEASVSAEGLKVLRIDPQSTAAQLGLKPDDIVRTINGRLITSTDDLREALQANEQSTYYYLSGMRKGAWYEDAAQPFRAVLRKEGNSFAVVQAVQSFARPVGESNLNAPQIAAFRDLGIETADGPNGVRLTRVEPNGLAARIGLEAGDVLQKVNSKPVDKIEGLRAALQQEQMALYYVSGIRPSRGDQAFLAVLRRNQGQMEFAQELQWFSRPNADPFQPNVAVGQKFDISYFFAEARTDRDGIRFVSVTPLGLAHKLGLQAEDVITTVNGRPVYTEAELRAALVQTAGEVCYIAGTRQGRPFTASLRKQENSVSVNERVEIMEATTHTGLRPTNTLGQQVNLVEIGAWAQVERDGLRLSRVEERTVAASIGLRTGDLIKTVNGRPVYAAREFSEAIFESQSETVFVEGQRAQPYAQPFMVLLRRDRGGVVAAKPQDWEAQERYRQLLVQAQAAEDLRNFDEAIRLFKQASELRPNHPDADTGVKRARYSQAMDKGEQALYGRRNNEAVRWFEDALLARPGDPRAIELLRRARGGSY